MYELYKEIGEPHTVETFLKNTCLKRGQSLPCYKPLAQWNGIQVGKNVTTLNNQLSFQEGLFPGFFQCSCLKCSIAVGSPNNGCRNKPEGLSAFTTLGRKKILASIAKICPPQLQYRLSFLEFYEIVLVLAYRKAEQDRTALLDRSRVLARTAELLTAKRKNKLKKL